MASVVEEYLFEKGKNFESAAGRCLSWIGYPGNRANTVWFLGWKDKRFRKILMISVSSLKLENVKGNEEIS